MYIGRLQLKGFKSFGGAHDLPLAPGMTAIVGPNGSGKSNLLDALRWVLGDSHASKLRIARQGDLLFQGSASMPQAREAEVAVQLREETRVCTVRRRVAPDGATQALVDGVRVNLSELDEAKRLWRLEGDRFAFIGQGEVAEVIQQRPSARRMLLESLFGIDLYRKRRTEASGRLDEANEEYERLKNFSAELTARRAEIAPEVERASVARKLLDSLEDERKLLYWIRRTLTVTEIARAADDLRAQRADAEYRFFWHRAWRHSIALIEGRLAEISQARENQVRELEESKGSLASLIRTGYSHGTSLATARKRLTQIADERVELASKHEKLKSDQKKSASESQKIKADLDARRTELAEAESRWRAFSETRDAERLEREKRNEERGRLDAEIQQLRARLASLGGSMRALAEGGGAAPDSSARGIKKELDVLEKKSEKLLSDQEAAAIAHRDVYAALQEVSGELQRSRRESSRLSSQLVEISDQAQLDIYPRPVQHVVSASRLGKLRAKPRVVVDAFTCPHELALAMESYLGGRQFWLLVEDMDEAGRCIDQLKAASAGRATFLPLDRCKPRRPDRSAKFTQGGVVGWAIDLLKCEAHWKAALEHLAGDLLIVEDYGTGQRIVKNGFRGPVATLDGDVFQPAGSISGGKNERSSKAIELKAMLNKLESECATARKRTDELSEEFSKLEETELAAQNKKDEISQQIRDLAAARSALDARREEILRERERAKSEREALLSSLRSGGDEWLSTKKRREALAEEAPEAESGDDVEFVRTIERLKSKIAVIEEKQRSSFVLGERVIAELRSNERVIASLDEETSSCDSSIISDKGALSRLGKRYYEIYLRRRTLLEEMKEFGGRYEDIVRRRDARVTRTEAARDAAEEVSRRVAALEQRGGDLERELGELVANWEEQYPYPGPDDLPDIDPEELRRNIREQERAVRAMGDVDMGVLSEDRNLRDRIAYLSAQLDDVHQSMIDLEKLIEDADNQARAIFTDALAEIDTKFNDLFQRLFGGGEAHLEMVEGESLWDSGVDVVARPPGKHPQSIAQLSGGEQSLSAISLLFASLEVAKSPIAVLDEVDAALDEVNLRRFAELTREAAADRQIFVMTHRRVTMERADALYGVTLSEPGLSQVIGVRVEDWA